MGPSLKVRTSKHSSRLRTACLLIVYRSIRGVGGVCPGGLCLPMGGVCLRGCVSQHAMGQTPPMWTEWLTDRCKKHYFAPKLRLRAVIYLKGLSTQFTQAPFRINCAQPSTSEQLCRKWHSHWTGTSDCNQVAPQQLQNMIHFISSVYIFRH